ncbi:MAG TPA: uracil-DNA glycosylase [Vicinamibacterales bacterium]|nr:uracil-DNA glycosylase [Vicinamibacterales bacterium]
MSTGREVADHLRFFASLGVTGVSRDAAWRTREGDAPVPGEPASGETAPIGQDDEESGGASRALARLQEHIGDCTRCKLHAQGRSQVVFGTGNPSAALMFVGEAPGADEDRLGEPFVGRAGQLLTKIIEAIGLARADVYIANVIKCRPPGNRNPEADEVATCEPFLFEQIDVIRPKVIVALGTFAAHALLKTDAPISRLRGRVHDFRGGSKLIPTFHPAFLLRSPDRKRDVWEDMKKVRALLAEE